ncbi:MAG: hypothetical protein GY869_31730 [Planctomycetes bacterium]|nr:hypothetical protein [Planctomycetota bacterium]
MSSVNTDKTKHQVVFYTYPKFIFCWPLIAVGFLLCLFGGWNINQVAVPVEDTPVVVPEEDPAVPIEPTEQAAGEETAEGAVATVSNGTETLAWIWIITLVIVIITVGFDLSRNFTVFWLVLIIALWFMISWLAVAKEVTIFKHLYEIIADLNPQYSAPMGLAVSIALSILYLIMWIWTRINSKWRITHNEFEHYQFGRMDDSLARGAKRVRTSYPDFFEFLVCLAGDLIIFDSTGRRQLRRIPHVPFLPIVRKRINLLLERTAITAEMVDDEAEAPSAEDLDSNGDDDRSI